LPYAAAADENEEVPPDDVWHHDTLGWELGGVRPFLLEHDMTLGITDVEEVLGNPSGGMHQGSAYDGATIVSLTADLEGLVGWTGATVGVYAAELRGHGLSTHAVGNLMTVSNLEVEPQTRLLDALFEQSLADDAVSIRLGYIAAADEFWSTRYATAFMNSSFGWPTIVGVDLPGQDPSAPLATPGIRFKLTEGDITWQTGLYQGPSNTMTTGPGTLQFGSTGGGVLVISEAAYAFAVGEDLPATAKIGGWYHTAQFADQRVDQQGVPLAQLGSTTPRLHDGDWGAYLGLEALLWRVPDSVDRGIGAFVRAAAAPGDRNLVSSYVDAGVILKGVMPQRRADLIGLAFARSGISHAASGFDEDINGLLGGGFPVRDAETVIELTYQAMLTPWWTLQPDVQYVIHPGGNSPNPEAAAGYPPIPDALVLGLRSTIKF